MIPGMAAPLHGPVTLSMPFSAESAGRVREELVGNAVRHARPLRNGTVLVRWHEEGTALELSVCDGGGETAPELVDAAPTDVSGRGLAIVDALSSTWWVEHSSQLHTVHARVALD
jgi:serine/threonine-protein kinase RsbW